MIVAENLVKNFHNGQMETQALKGVSISIAEGEFVAIIGPSGAGKSTLMYQLSLLDHPTSGEIIIDGKNVTEFSSDQRTAFRLNSLGYVFQDYALLPELTAAENIMVPLLMKGLEKKLALKKIAETLAQVGLTEKSGNLPSQLSGGQQQRVSIARAIAHDPKILFADEPTANLDTKTSREILKLFLELNAKGQTIVMVTHEKEFAEMAKRVVSLKDGVIESDLKRN